MATTVNYGFDLPVVGGAEDTWGTDLNANWTALDTLLGGTNATEFAILDGATVSTAELNLLDGVTWTLTDYNTLTATAAELNQLDGVTALTGADGVLVTGTAGTDGQIAQWNADGDVVGVDKTLPEADWEAGTSTTESLVSPAKIKAAIDVLAPPQSPRLISTTTLTDDEATVTITGLGGYRHIMAWTDANLTSGAVRELVVGSAGGFVTSGYICEDASDRSSIRLHNNNTAANQSGLIIIYNFNTTDAVKPVINAINRSDKVTAIGSATAFDRIRFELSEVLSEYVTGSRFLVWGWN